MILLILHSKNADLQIDVMTVSLMSSEDKLPYEHASVPIILTSVPLIVWTILDLLLIYVNLRITIFKESERI